MHKINAIVRIKLFQSDGECELTLMGAVRVSLVMVRARVEMYLRIH